MIKKIAKEELEALIKTEFYIVVPESTMTLCVLELANGFRVTGESACLNPADFDAELGRKYAYEDAFNQLWKLEGYARASEDARKPKFHTPKDRVEAELAEVHARIGGLSTFIKNGQHSVCDLQWELLHEQRSHMKAYASVLQTRLEVWDKP